jgi:hypothetical protein
MLSEVEASLYSRHQRDWRSKLRFFDSVSLAQTDKSKFVERSSRDNLGDFRKTRLIWNKERRSATGRIRHSELGQPSNSDG